MLTMPKKFQSFKPKFYYKDESNEYATFAGYLLIIFTFESDCLVLDVLGLSVAP